LEDVMVYGSTKIKERLRRVFSEFVDDIFQNIDDITA